MRSSTLAKRVAALALTKKAHDLVIMDLRSLSTVTDFFVICSADSEVQARAIADVVDEGLEKHGTRPWHRESGSSHWILLDYVDVVLHVFHTHTRQFYNLEKLWGDAKIQHISDDVPARLRRTAGSTPRTRRTLSARATTI